MFALTLPFAIIGLIWALIAGLYIPAAIFGILAFLPIGNIVFVIPELFNGFLLKEKAKNLQTIITLVWYLSVVTVTYVSVARFYSGLDIIPLSFLCLSYFISVSTGIFQTAKEQTRAYSIHESMIWMPSNQQAALVAATMMVYYTIIMTVVICIYAAI